MADLLSTLGVAVVVFVSTNIDDVFLLAAFLADSRHSTRAIFLGQFAGLGALVAVSVVAALASITIPKEYVALLGIVPLALGLWELWKLRRGIQSEASESAEIQRATHRASARTHSTMMAVASVTVANGGDNLGVYIPLFARDPRLIPLFAIAFLAMTALLCLAGYQLAGHRVLGAHLRRYGHVALPIVLIALGLWILADARALVAPR